MAIKSSDGKISMTLSSPDDKVFLGGIALITNTIKGMTTTPIIQNAELEVKAEEIGCTFNKDLAEIEMYNINKA